MADSSKVKKTGISYPMTRVKVVGVGGAGSNAVSRMIGNPMRGVEFIAINTDHQDLDHCEARRKIYIGRNLTKGLGTGMNPELGRQSAEENRSEIAEAVQGADLVFITAGFGGGTGTGASPIVAEVAKQGGALTLAFITKPFSFEGSQRSRIADEGLLRLKDKVDALVVIPNDRIFTVISKDTPILKAFEAIDEVMRRALHGIVELIVAPGLVNVDFADVEAVVRDAGSAIVGLGIASGPDRAVNAVNQAIHSPLLEATAEGAKGVILGIAGGRDMRMTEINEAAKVVAQVADPGARIIFGAYYDRHLKPNQLKVIVIATGANGVPPANSLFGSRGEKAVSFPVGLEEGSYSREMGKEKEGMGVTAGARVAGGAGDQDAGSAPSKPREQGAPKKTEEKLDVWDIPTFLRKKGKR